MINRVFTLLILGVIGVGLYAYFGGLQFADLKESLTDEPVEQVNDLSTVKPSGKTNLNSSNERTTSTNKLRADAFQPIPASPFEKIDRHARNAPASAASSVSSLATYLSKVAKTDLDKARVIYTWLAENIRYDDLAFNTGNYADYTPDHVLQTKVAVCDGFSNLYVALGREMGLDVKKVPGYSKGFGYRPGSRFKKADHAWNVIAINGQWRVFDATWGQGNGTAVKGKLVSVKKFDDFWFNVDPYASIFSHYPEDPSFAYVQPMISLKDYEQLPRVEKSYFDVGFQGYDLFTLAQKDKKIKLPTCYKVDTHVEMNDAPAEEKLQLNKTYYFDFFVPRGERVAIIDARKNWTYLERSFGRFTGSYTPTVPGQLFISTKHENGGKAFHSILKYQVERERF